MAAEGQPGNSLVTSGLKFDSSDFGLDMDDVEEFNNEEDSDEDEAEEEDDLDPVEAERRRRAKSQHHLRRRAGEPEKPKITEVHKLKDNFLVMLREVLAA